MQAVYVSSIAGFTKGTMMYTSAWPRAALAKAKVCNVKDTPGKALGSHPSHACHSMQEQVHALRQAQNT